MRDDLRRTILAASLPHVPFDGWSARALQAGLRHAGLPADAGFRAFPRGPRDMLAFYLEEEARRIAGRLAAANLAELRVRERVATGVRLTLEGTDRELARRTFLTLGLPGHGGIALRGLYGIVDEIWRAAGDRSTDYNFYTKRALLAGVFLSTLVYWLNDDSPGSEASWEFLDRRIADAMRVPQLATPLRAAAGRMGDFARGAAFLARGLSGFAPRR